MRCFDKIVGSQLDETVSVNKPSLVTYNGTSGSVGVYLNGVLLATLSVLEPTLEIKTAGSYRLFMHVGSCKKARVCVHDLFPTGTSNPSSPTPTASIVCAHPIGDPDSVVRAWACATCGGNGLNVVLFALDGTLLINHTTAG